MLRLWAGEWGGSGGLRADNLVVSHPVCSAISGRSLLPLPPSPLASSRFLPLLSLPPSCSLFFSFLPLARLSLSIHLPLLASSIAFHFSVHFLYLKLVAKNQITSEGLTGLLYFFYALSTMLSFFCIKSVTRIWIQLCHTRCSSFSFLHVPFVAPIPSLLS